MCNVELVRACDAGDCGASGTVAWRSCLGESHAFGGGGARFEFEDAELALESVAAVSDVAVTLARVPALGFGVPGLSRVVDVAEGAAAVLLGREPKALGRCRVPTGMVLGRGVTSTNSTSVALRC